MDGIGAILGILMSIACVLLGIYGIGVDIFHGHWMWTLLDIISGGFIGVIRGFGHYFGYIPY